jgi:hypothetical protein
MAKDVLQNINVDLQKVPNEKCDNCGHGLLKVVYIVKRISALISPTGKEALVPIQVFACDKCGNVPKIFGNLADTEEIPASAGESLGDAVASTPTVESDNQKFLSK